MVGPKSNQVFFDPTGRRTLWVNRVFAVVLTIIAAITAVFLVSSFSTPALPSIPLTLEQQYLPPLPDPQRNSRRSGPVFNISHARSQSDLRTSSVSRLAFYNNWDRNSFLSLRNHASQLDALLPEWLHLANADGDVSLDDPREQRIVEVWLEGNAPALKVIPVVNNFDLATNQWLGAATGRLLRSRDARASLVANLQTYLGNGRYAGIAIDFKQVPEPDQIHLINLVTELSAALAPRQQKVLVVVPAYENPASYLQLVDAVDHLILLAYDQHASSDTAGPVAAQGWFEALLDRRFEKAPGSKLIVAIGSYAMDWPQSGNGNVISVPEAWDIMHRSDARLAFNNAMLNSMFQYRAKSTSIAHTVWMLDGVTMFNQIAAALAMEPAGIALWRLGTEDPTVWSTFAKGRVPSSASLGELQALDPGQTIAYRGKGEILKFSDKARVGKREVQHLVEHNLITGQAILTSPQPMMISRSGFNSEKVIALTFDDGPSRSHSLEILDILKQKDIKATFFVIGSEAALEPAILTRMYAEGHDIGNHTFTHPDLSTISSAQLDLELNATQRVLESKLGIHSVLFRPPFVKDIEPETQRQARTLQASSALGYIAIGQTIDPLDWGRPGADQIVRRTVDYTLRQVGNIVLLHDGGGDRSQTVDALPRIIDELHANGFRFATVHELLGLKRHDLMPPLARSGDYVPIVNDVGFSLMRAVNELVKALFVIGIVMGAARLLVIALAACWHAKSDGTNCNTQTHDLRAAVIVPAFNEELVIGDCIRSLLLSTRTDVEILVVDDGSTDGTSAVVRKCFSDEARVRLIVKQNGGKSTALNQGIHSTDADIVICIDADTRLAPDAVGLLLAGFSNSKVGAVAGVVTVGNQVNLLSRFQAIEYISAQSMERRALSLVNGISVVPGAIGAWRREAILAVGLYDSDTYAEDADLTVKLERAGWLVIQESMAFAVTEAPDTIREFNKQRFRWMFGTLQVTFKHAGVYFQSGVWGLKACTFPNIIVYQVFFTLISPVMDLLLAAAIGNDLWSIGYHGSVGISDRTVEIIAYWALFQTCELAFTGLAITLHRGNRPWNLLPLTVLQRFGYRQLLFWILLRTSAAALRGRMATWGKCNRKGFVTQAPTLQLGRNTRLTRHFSGNRHAQP